MLLRINEGRFDVQGRSANAAIKRGNRIIVDGVVRCRGRHKRNWVEASRLENA